MYLTTGQCINSHGNDFLFLITGGGGRGKGGGGGEGGREKGGKMRARTWKEEGTVDYR